MPRRLLAAGFAAIAMLAAAPSAFAATPTLVVTRGDGASDCPDASKLAASVAELMGHPAFDVTTPAGAPTPDAYTVEIARGGLYTASIHSQGGERDLSDPGPGCASLADALALTLAILLDPEGRPPSPMKHDVPPKPPEPHHDPAPEKAIPKGPPIVAVEAGAGVAIGVVQSPSVAITGGFDLRASSLFSIRIGAVVAPSGTLQFDQGSMSLTMIGGAVSPCAPEIGRVERIRLRACADLVVGGLRETPAFSSTFHAQSTTVLWFGAGPEARLDGTIVGPLGWMVGGEVLFTRPQQFLLASGPGVNAEQKNLRTVDLLVTAGVRVSIF